MSGKQVSDAISEGIETTAWQVMGLLENTRYYWRVNASDGSANSEWTVSSFFVNRINDAPSTPTVKNPGNSAWVNTRTPVLSLHAASGFEGDPDGDSLEYQFEVYSNAEITRFVVQGDAASPDWTASRGTKMGHPFPWRTPSQTPWAASSVPTP